MRELKFRLIKDDKIVGYELFLDGKWVYAYPEGNFNINIPYIEHDYKEQFTGLKDQNGVEIYEGDIIADISHGNLLRTFVVEDIRTITREFDNSEHSSEWHRIGNIHENKELIK
jgi:hypothetical protein